MEAELNLQVVGVDIDTPADALAAGKLLNRRHGLLQYRANDIDAAEVQALVAALPARAHVAPNPDLPAAVVLTAFLTKQECSAIDLGSVEDFTDDHAGERVDR